MEVADRQTKKLKVVVVGGGLVGSLEALYLAKRGYQVSLYEYREDIRATPQVRGRSINLALSVRGRKALRDVGLEDHMINKHGIPMRARMIHRPDGSTYEIPYDTRTKQEKVPVQTYPGCREALREAFLRKGAPEAALHIMLSSLANNTLQQYGSTYKLWWSFCNNLNLNPYSTFTDSVVLSFLTNQFDRGTAYGSLYSHRSALALLLNQDFSSNSLITRFFKGIYKLRLTFPKYVATWDPQVVLNHIAQWKPHDDLYIEKLTKKVTILLALCTAHRAQTLSLIKIKNIKFSTTDIKIVISDLIKTSAAGREQPLLTLPYFLENRDICPATALQDYIRLTERLRTGNTDKLLLTWRAPHRAATSQTIARWIKQVLAECGVDVATFSAHSARHAATSAASRAGVSLDVIRKTAGWTPASNTFARFYNRKIVDDNQFARAVCSQSLP